jgi:hypothetical protein
MTASTAPAPDRGWTMVSAILEKRTRGGAGDLAETGAPMAGRLS